MSRISYNGEEFEFERAEAMMDPDLRRMVEQEHGTRSEQELVDAYAAAHLAITGEEFYIP